MKCKSSYNYSRLRGRIVEKFGSNAQFARKIGLSEHTLSLKLNNLSVFRQDEIKKSMELLDISYTELADYFFCNATSQM